MRFTVTQGIKCIYHLMVGADTNTMGNISLRALGKKKKSSLQKKGSKKGLKVRFFPYPITPKKKGQQQEREKRK